MTPDDTTGPADRRGGAAHWLAYALAIGALGVSTYLSFVSLTTGESPAGCGSGSGCAQVMASKWSRVWGIPVSVLAVVAYLDVLFAFWLDQFGKDWTRVPSRYALTIWSAVIVGSAGWFVYLQLFELKAVCPYCMAGHGLGVALVVVLMLRGRLRHLWTGLLGFAAVLLMILIQMNANSAVTTIENTSDGQNTDQTKDGRRTISLLNGQLTADLAEEPLLGRADAEHVLALMFDYACPHCRHTHGVLQQMVEAYPGRVAVIALPTPLNPSCNEHVPGDMGARFKESCELARIGLAMFFADRGGFPAFDRWMYEPETPRTAEEARSEAVKRVGEDRFEQAYNDPRTEQMMARNVEVYGQSGADRVPVLVLPAGHESAAIVGRIDQAGQVTELLGLETGGGSQ